MKYSRAGGVEVTDLHQQPHDHYVAPILRYPRGGLPRSDRRSADGGFVSTQFQSMCRQPHAQTQLRTTTTGESKSSIPYHRRRQRMVSWRQKVKVQCTSSIILFLFFTLTVLGQAVHL